MSQLLGREDFLYKKNFDYVNDYATFVRTLNNAKSSVGRDEPMPYGY